MTDSPSIAVIIVAAGSGERFGGDTPKQWRQLGGQSLVERSIRSFQHELLRRAGQAHIPGLISLVVHPDHDEYLTEFPDAPATMTVTGGPTRTKSVYNALKLIPDDFDFIAVHDAVRPFWPLEMWDELVNACMSHDGAVLAIPCGDTLKRLREGKMTTVDRDSLWMAQTPQIFRAQILKKAHLSALRGDITGTDDAEIVEHAGGSIALIPSARSNIKITTPDDWNLAERIAGSCVPSQSMRVGIGYDTHRLGGNGPLMLGGVMLAGSGGLIGHSDGDALLHAICDALLGAAALGDIGQHFPPGDKKFAGIDSRELVRRTVAILTKAGYRPVQVDATVMAEAPKIMPHAPLMRDTIARDLGISASMVSVKATTNEQMGFIGRGEGIAAQAVCTIESIA